jgi:hypothetical protein
MRLGDGSTALSAAAAPVFIDEYTPAGVLVQSVALPTTVSGAHKQLVLNGNGTTSGNLTRSADGNYLLLCGYGAAVATASVNGANGLPRVIGRIDASGTIDTTTALDGTTHDLDFRGAASLDGTAFWTIGQNLGVRYSLLGGTTSTSVCALPINMRFISVQNGQLYFSCGIASASAAFAISTVGAGTPTGSGQTGTVLPGLPATTTTQAFAGFFFADLSTSVAGVDTLYVADENSSTSVAGLRKFSLVGGNWTSNGTVDPGPRYRHITGKVSGGTVTLYATKDATTFVKLTDSSGYNAAFTGTPTVLATAGTNTAYRGVAFLPAVPDTTPPTVVSIVRQTPTGQTTTSASLTFRVTFSEAVNAPTTANFAVAAVNSSTITGTIASVTTVSTSVYDVAVTITGGTGEFRLKVID